MLGTTQGSVISHSFETTYFLLLLKLGGGSYLLLSMMSCLLFDVLLEKLI